MTSDESTRSRVEAGKTDQPFFDAQLPPGELERILSRIEENLVFRQQFNAPAGPTVPVVGSVTFLEQQLQAIRALNAPYYRPELSSGAGVWLRRMVNYVLRLFGYKQAQYNTQLLDTMQAAIVYLHQELTTQRQNTAALQSELEQLRQQLATLTSNGTLDGPDTGRTV